MRAVRVAWISITPVKSLGLTQVDEVQLEEIGVRNNRRFYLIDDAGNLINGKRHGALAQVRSGFDEAANTLELRFPDGRVVAGEVGVDGELTTNFWGRPVQGRIVVGPWSEALSEFAGSPLRLARPDRDGAGVDRGRIGAFSLVSRASLDALAREAGVERPVDFRRFRMLFGVEGVGEHEEDSWLGHEVRIGEAVLLPRTNVGRCAVTTQNPETGKPDLDTLKVLKTYRGEIPTTEPLPFGIAGEVVRPGRVRVGDAVSVG
jgi:uncharacterized protein YcbX